MRNITETDLFEKKLNFSINPMQSDKKQFNSVYTLAFISQKILGICYENINSKKFVTQIIAIGWDLWYFNPNNIQLAWFSSYLQRLFVLVHPLHEHIFVVLLLVVCAILPHGGRQSHDIFLFHLWIVFF